MRRARQRRRRRVTFTVAVLVTLAIGGWTLARSSLFALERIEVAGAKMLMRDDIVRASGLHVGASMLSLDLRAIERRIGRLPLVRTVAVSKPSPSRVRIVVGERTPSFVLETAEARWYIDAEGVVLASLSEPDASLPTVRLPSAAPADAGDRVRSTAVDDAFSLWRVLPAALRSGAPVIESAPGGLTLIRAGMTIRFGSLDRLGEKLEALSLVIGRAKSAKQHLAAVDVSSPGRPAASAA